MPGRRWRQLGLALGGTVALALACAAPDAPTAHGPAASPGGTIVWSAPTPGTAGRAPSLAGSPEQRSGGSMIGVRSGAGMPAVVSRLPGRDGVVFIGIDDGWTIDPRVAALIGRQHLPVSAFLIDDASRLHPQFFRSLQQAGVTIQDHTLTHPVLPRLSADAQRRQICAAADRLGATYGRRPTLLRPPYGRYNQATQQAAASCRIDAVILWDVTVNRGVIRTQGGPVRAGDVVLMHFTPNLYQDLNVLLGLLNRSHLRVARLEDAIWPAARRRPSPVVAQGPGRPPSPGRPTS